MFFAKEYSIELVISAVVTLGVILLAIRIYLNFINKKSKIIKPDWLDNDLLDKNKKDKNGK